MRHVWLHRAPAGAPAELVVFCNGWGMDERVVAGLDGTGCDVLCLYDYRRPEPDPALLRELAALTPSRRILVAWSLGVYMSGMLKRLLPPFHISVACNGTPRPIDARYGIPAPVYDATVQAMTSADARDRFMLRAGMECSLCRQDVAELREELEAVRRLVLEDTAEAPHFDLALVSAGDRIFPARSQRRYWQSCPGTRLIPLEGSHCPFPSFRAWRELWHG